MMSSIYSNSNEIPFNDKYFKPMGAFRWQQSSSEECVLEYEREGFLLLRGFVDREIILSARADYFRRFDPAFLAEDTAPVDGIFSGKRSKEEPVHGVEGHPAFDFARGEILRKLADFPQFFEIAKTILQGDVRRLNRVPIRHFVMDKPQASRAHLDATYLDVANNPFVTIWVPIGDCNMADGGILYLDRSSDLEIEDVRKNVASDRPNDPRPITHNLKNLADFTKRRWYYSNFRAGDVVLHSPQIVHASSNTMGRKMRLSADIRFARKDTVPDERWVNHWSADDGF